MGRRVYHSYYRGFRTCNIQQDIVDFLTANPGYYSETELFRRCFGYDRNNANESNKKYAELLRRAHVKGLVTRKLKAGSTSRYLWYLPTLDQSGVNWVYETNKATKPATSAEPKPQIRLSQMNILQAMNAVLITDTASEEKNFPKLLENRNNGQTFTLTNSNNINTKNTHNMENTTFVTATVQSCISSIFSKEDVLNLLEQQKAEILASIPEPKPTTELSRDIIRIVADAVFAAFESDIKNGLANVDFSDIANEAEVEIGYDRTIEVNIDERSARSAIEEVIGYELTDVEGLADLIEQQIDIAKHSVSE